MRYIVIFLILPFMGLSQKIITIGKCLGDMGGINLSGDTLFHHNSNGNLSYVLLPAGPAGVQGPPGPQGLTGPQGPPGINGTIPSTNLSTSSSNGIVTLNSMGQTNSGINVVGTGIIVANNSNPGVLALTAVDGSITNELQTISTNGNAGNITLSSSGGTLNLNVNDADANPSNEIQDLSLSGNTLSLTGDGTTVDLSSYLDNTDNQDLSLSGQTLSLTNDATPVTLPIIDVIQGTGVTVTKSNGVATVNATADGDGSSSNELQTISTNGNPGNISLSNTGGTLNLNVNDADANATNELQNLTLTGQTLDISQGAGVTLPIIDVVQGSGITVNKLNGIATISASSAGSTEYLDPYVISSDTVGFILKNVMDTVQFIGVAGVTGESTTVSDSPTINMTLTGTNISSEVIDGSITPAKLSQTYLTTEVDGSTTNEIQTLSIAGNNLTISGAGGNTVALPSGGGSSEWASLHYGSLAANTQTLTSSVWNTINFTGSSESNASVLDANHTNDEIEFVVAGTYRVDYRVSFIANADALIYSGIYSSASSSVDGNTQMESDTDSGYKHTIMQHSYIKTAVAGEKIKLQVQPLIAHTSVAIYSNFIVTKL